MSITSEQAEIINAVVTHLSKVEDSIEELNLRLPRPVKVPKARPVKSRPVNEPVQEEEEPEPVTGGIKYIRIGEGHYTFGSKKIHIRKLNGKLVIRIGGGYMMV